MKWLDDGAVNHLRAVAGLPDLSETPYRIIRKLGSGGMASVYLAEDTKLSRQVALKVTDSPGSPKEMALRMSAEARIIAQLEHPGIVPIHDVGTLPDGRIFYAMKFVQGSSLTDFAQPGGSISEKLRIFLKVCEAVSFAHSNGVIHRDLKPGNIMVGAFGEVLVMDWGVAKVLGNSANEKSTQRDFVLPPDSSGQTTVVSPDESEGSDIKTAFGTVLGTPSYMAPEQALGQISTHDQLTDVYALGAILFFLLTGKHPFGHSSMTEIREHFLRGKSLEARQEDLSIPRPLEAVCMKAMSAEPQNRYRSVKDLAADIELFLSDSPVSAYKENVFEKTARVINRYRFIVFLMFAYLFVRFLLYFLLRH